MFAVRKLTSPCGVAVFLEGLRRLLAALSVSTHFDFRLAHVDIAGSHAHADELHRVGLLTDQECAGHARCSGAPGR